MCNIHLYLCTCTYVCDDNFCVCLDYEAVTCVCDYSFCVCVGHEAVASEVGLGISTFKPSESPKL